MTKQSTSSSFYTSQNTVDSLVENPYDDLNLVLEDIDIGEIDRDLNDNASIGSSIGSGPRGTNAPLSTGPFQVLQGIGSDPVSIPGSEIIRHQSFNSQTSASPTSPLGHLGFFATTTVRSYFVIIFIRITVCGHMTVFFFLHVTVSRKPTN